MDQSPAKPEPNRIKGMCYVLISWIFFTSVIALARFAGPRSSVPTILLFQNFISLLFIIPWIIKLGKKSLYLQKIGLMSVRTLMGYISYAFIFLAIQKISLVEVVLLSNSAPLFIPWRIKPQVQWDL